MKKCVVSSCGIAILGAFLLGACGSSAAEEPLPTVTEPVQLKTEENEAISDEPELSESEETELSDSGEEVVTSFYEYFGVRPVEEMPTLTIYDYNGEAYTEEENQFSIDTTGKIKIIEFNGLCDAYLSDDKDDIQRRASHFVDDDTQPMLSYIAEKLGAPTAIYELTMLPELSEREVNDCCAFWLYPEQNRAIVLQMDLDTRGRALNDVGVYSITEFYVTDIMHYSSYTETTYFNQKLRDYAEEFSEKGYTHYGAELMDFAEIPNDL